jgi:acetyl-CoA carboxylase carboxyltransferase component
LTGENRPRRDAEIWCSTVRHPFRSAEAFWIEEIIDPRATRPLLCEFAELAAPLRETGPSTHRMRP